MDGRVPPAKSQEFALARFCSSVERKRSDRDRSDRPTWAANRPIPVPWPATRPMLRHQGRFLVTYETTSTMCTTVNDVHTLDELRRFIHQTLCEKENLVADQITMTEVQLIRGNQPCGFQFCLRGPRSVRLGAIWAADQNVVYLYDASGRTRSCGSRIGWR